VCGDKKRENEKEKKKKGKPFGFVFLPNVFQTPHTNQSVCSFSRSDCNEWVGCTRDNVA
jgi:hypothetical protein